MGPPRPAAPGRRAERGRKGNEVWKVPRCSENDRLMWTRRRTEKVGGRLPRLANLRLCRCEWTLCKSRRPLHRDHPFHRAGRPMREWHVSLLERSFCWLDRNTGTRVRSPLPSKEADGHMTWSGQRRIEPAHLEGDIRILFYRDINHVFVW